MTTIKKTKPTTKRLTKAQRVKAFERFLLRNVACYSAKRWVKGKTIHEAWRECPYKDWLLWLIRYAEIKHSLWDEMRTCGCDACCPESLETIKCEIKLPAVFPWERL
jgi:hypothetical protein